MMRNVLDIEISCFESYYKKNDPVLVNLLMWLKSDEYKGKILQLREVEDKKERDKLKAQIPAITISGTFRACKDEELIQHSGLICLDLDPKGNEWIGDVTRLKGLFAELPEVAYVGESASGKGIFVIIPIQFPHKHKEHFTYLQNHYSLKFRRLAEKRGLLLPDNWYLFDIRCSNLSRLRGYSYDPKAYFNPFAKPVIKYENPNGYIQRPHPSRRIRTHVSHGTNFTNRNLILAFIEEVEDNQTDLVGNERINWVKLGYAFLAEFGREEGLELFLRAVRYSNRFDHTIATREFNRLNKPSGITGKTFVWMCKEAGLSLKHRYQKGKRKTLESPNKGRNESKSYNVVTTDLKPESPVTGNNGSYMALFHYCDINGRGEILNNPNATGYALVKFDQINDDLPEWNPRMISANQLRHK